MIPCQFVSSSILDWIVTTIRRERRMWRCSEYCVVRFVACAQVPALAGFSVSALFAFQVLVGLLKVKKLDKQEKLITGTA